MIKSKWFIILFIVACVGVSLVFAQRYYNRRYSGRRGVPDWEPDKDFSRDVFTFVRIRYSSGYGGRGYRGGYGRGSRGGDWATDYPDSDLNFSFRLHQLTSMEVNPDGLVLELTDPRLYDYPFIYIVEPGNLVFSEEEVKILRNYLFNGGFLMVDDFWGEDEWYNFYYEIKRVFPNREPKELSLTHPIFHAVFDLKEKPQIPSIGAAIQGRDYGITWEREDAQIPYYKAIYDDKGRMMAIICHNTDLGDGWEREGEDEWYFREFSEKKAYPLGINIVFYAMTH
ncbi:MAG: DUF4159 domain-containing protein [Planctomycetes bacterium]|nr:DUF4159 domain-containing protein [Planctomycetota bacterium]